MDFDKERSDKLAYFMSYYKQLNKDEKAIINRYLNQHIKNRNQGIPMIPPFDQLDKIIGMEKWITQQSNDFIDLLLNYVSAMYGEHNYKFSGNIYTPPQSPRGGSKKTYKGKKYTVRTGPKGGTYLLVNGIKRYISP